MALIYSDEAVWDALSDEERTEIYGRYRELSRRGAAAGVMQAGDSWADADATTVRVREAESLVLDGPYAETKESLGGYFLFECDSIDEAIDWAARIPLRSTAPSRFAPSSSTRWRR